jgi:LacI family transcriptional regulator
MALNDKPGISQKLRQVIKDKAKEMGYIPNQAARNLVLKKTNKIGLFLLSRPLLNERIVSYSNELFQELMEEANDRKYNILLYTLNNDLEMKKSYAEFCREENLKGAVFIGFRTDDPHLNELKTIEDTIVVVFDIKIGQDVNEVFTDNKTGITELFELFKQKNYRNIAVLSGQKLH